MPEEPPPRSHPSSAFVKHYSILHNIIIFVGGPSRSAAGSERAYVPAVGGSVRASPPHGGVASVAVQAVRTSERIPVFGSDCLGVIRACMLVFISIWWVSNRAKSEKEFEKGRKERDSRKLRGVL
ncbi:hypothetical protein C8J57DRAFT_1222511 [Mycena rebaudengoi]|nr:hypothetical protein C8J57DRAFT_1222511 [Mycena rebaudengoi]